MYRSTYLAIRASRYLAARDAALEPFGPDLYRDVEDWDAFRRQTIHAAIGGVDVRRHRAAAAAAPVTYRGGPVAWPHRDAGVAA